jgi:hypothetical protein
MKFHRSLHLSLVVACLLLLGGCLWWAMRRMQPAADGVRSVTRSEVLPPTVPKPVASANRPPVRLPAAPESAIQESPERRALRAEAVALQEDLARAQEALVAGADAGEPDEVMLRFSESHRSALRKADETLERYLNPKDVPARPRARTDVDEARNRFAAVRRAVLEEGLTLDAAEARHPAPNSDP